MNGTITDSEALRLLLTLRRQVFAEFKVWVSIDDKEAYQILCQKGAHSAKGYVRQLAEQLLDWYQQTTQLKTDQEDSMSSRARFADSLRETDAPSMSGAGVVKANPATWTAKRGTESTTRPVTQPVTSTPKQRYYRGVLIPAAEPTQTNHPTDLNSGLPHAESPAAPHPPQIYRGQIIKQ